MTVLKEKVKVQARKWYGEAIRQASKKKSKPYRKMNTPDEIEEVTAGNLSEDAYLALEDEKNKKNKRIRDELMTRLLSIHTRIAQILHSSGYDVLYDIDILDVAAENEKNLADFHSKRNDFQEYQNDVITSFEIIKEQLMEKYILLDDVYLWLSTLSLADKMSEQEGEITAVLEAMSVNYQYILNDIKKLDNLMRRLIKTTKSLMAEVELKFAVIAKPEPLTIFDEASMLQNPAKFKWAANTIETALTSAVGWIDKPAYQKNVLDGLTQLKYYTGAANHRFFQIDKTEHQLQETGQKLYEAINNNRNLNTECASLRSMVGGYQKDIFELNEKLGMMKVETKLASHKMEDEINAKKAAVERCREIEQKLQIALMNKNKAEAELMDLTRDKSSLLKLTEEEKSKKPGPIVIPDETTPPDRKDFTPPAIDGRRRRSNYRELMFAIKDLEEQVHKTKEDNLDLQKKLLEKTQTLDSEREKSAKLEVSGSPDQTGVSESALKSNVKKMAETVETFRANIGKDVQEQFGVQSIKNIPEFTIADANSQVMFHHLTSNLQNHMDLIQENLNGIFKRVSKVTKESKVGKKQSREDVTSSIKPKTKGAKAGIMDTFSDVARQTSVISFENAPVTTDTQESYERTPSRRLKSQRKSSIKIKQSPKKSSRRSMSVDLDDSAKLVDSLQAEYKKERNMSGGIFIYTDNPRQDASTLTVQIRPSSMYREQAELETIKQLYPFKEQDEYGSRNTLQKYESFIQEHSIIEKISTQSDLGKLQQSSQVVKDADKRTYALESGSDRGFSSDTNFPRISQSLGAIQMRQREIDREKLLIGYNREKKRITEIINGMKEKPVSEYMAPDSSKTQITEEKSMKGLKSEKYKIAAALLRKTVAKLRKGYKQHEDMGRKLSDASIVTFQSDEDKHVVVTSSIDQQLEKFGEITTPHDNLSRESMPGLKVTDETLDAVKLHQDYNEQEDVELKETKVSVVSSKSDEGKHVFAASSVDEQMEKSGEITTPLMPSKSVEGKHVFAVSSVDEQMETSGEITTPLMPSKSDEEKHVVAASSVDEKMEKSGEIITPLMPSKSDEGKHVFAASSVDEQMEKSGEITTLKPALNVTDKTIDADQQNNTIAAAVLNELMGKSVVPSTLPEDIGHEVVDHHISQKTFDAEELSEGESPITSKNLLSILYKSEVIADKDLQTIAKTLFSPDSPTADTDISETLEQMDSEAREHAELEFKTSYKEVLKKLVKKGEIPEEYLQKIAEALINESSYGSYLKFHGDINIEELVAKDLADIKNDIASEKLLQTIVNDSELPDQDLQQIAEILLTDLKYAKHFRLPSEADIKELVSKIENDDIRALVEDAIKSKVEHIVLNRTDSPIMKLSGQYQLFQVEETELLHDGMVDTSGIEITPHIVKESFLDLTIDSALYDKAQLSDFVVTEEEIKAKAKQLPKTLTLAPARERPMFREEHYLSLGSLTDVTENVTGVPVDLEPEVYDAIYDVKDILMGDLAYRVKHTVQPLSPPPDTGRLLETMAYTKTVERPVHKLPVLTLSPQLSEMKGRSSTKLIKSPVLSDTTDPPKRKEAKLPLQYLKLADKMKRSFHTMKGGLSENEEIAGLQLVSNQSRSVYQVHQKHDDFSKPINIINKDGPSVPDRPSELHYFSEHIVPLHSSQKWNSDEYLISGSKTILASTDEPHIDKPHKPTIDNITSKTGYFTNNYPKSTEAGAAGFEKPNKSPIPTKDNLTDKTRYSTNISPKSKVVGAVGLESLNKYIKPIFQNKWVPVDQTGVILDVNNLGQPVNNMGYEVMSFWMPVPALQAQPRYRINVQWLPTGRMKYPQMSNDKIKYITIVLKQRTKVKPGKTYEVHIENEIINWCKDFDINSLQPMTIQDKVLKIIDLLQQKDSLGLSMSCVSKIQGQLISHLRHINQPTGEPVDRDSKIALIDYILNEASSLSMMPTNIARLEVLRDMLNSDGEKGGKIINKKILKIEGLLNDSFSYMGSENLHEFKRRISNCIKSSVECFTEEVCKSEVNECVNEFVKKASDQFPEKSINRVKIYELEKEAIHLITYLSYASRRSILDRIHNLQIAINKAKQRMTGKTLKLLMSLENQKMTEMRNKFVGDEDYVEEYINRLERKIMKKFRRRYVNVHNLATWEVQLFYLNNLAHQVGLSGCMTMKSLMPKSAAYSENTVSLSRPALIFPKLIQRPQKFSVPAIQAYALKRRQTRKFTIYRNFQNVAYDAWPITPTIQQIDIHDRLLMAKRLLVKSPRIT